MTTNQPTPTLYQTTWKQTFNSLDELALHGIEKTAPLLGGMECSAAQYTFAVSEDGGADWRNPTDEEK